jgi:hypothetical protein
LGAATPLLVLLIGALNAAAGTGAAGAPVLRYAYAVVFVTAGAFAAGSGIGISNYLLDIAPETERPLYLAFTNTLFGLARFTGMASGLIVDFVGITVLMSMAAVCYLAALFLARKMVEPRG